MHGITPEFTFSPPKRRERVHKYHHSKTRTRDYRGRVIWDKDPWFYVEKSESGQDFHLDLIHMPSAKKPGQILTDVYSPPSVHSFVITNACHIAAEQRIKELEEEAAEESIKPSGSSKDALLNFLTWPGVSSDPMITLREDGKFRALWEDETGNQIGISFNDSKTVSYVIMKTTKMGEDRHYGSSDTATVYSIILSTDMDFLLSDTA